MRGRFGRRRGRGGSDSTRTQIDPRALERLVEEQVLSLRRLEERRFEGISEGLARVGVGEAEDGSEWLVAVAPQSGGDAVLAALAASVVLAGEGFRGRAAAVSSAWGASDRRRLGCLAATPLPIQALSLAARPEDAGSVRAEYPQAPVPVPVDRVASQLETPAARALYARGVEGLRGLAAKHGGSLRGAGPAVELAILARRVARLRADHDRVVLETLLPSRSETPLDEASLAEALDRLEGYVRKRLSERGVRDGEEGWRGRVIPALAAAAELRFWQRWPVGGAELDVLDLVGVGPQGEPVAGVARQGLTLLGLGRVLDAVLALDGVMPMLLAAAEPPVRFGTPRLLLAAERTDSAVDAVLSHLALASACFDVRDSGAGAAVLVARGETPHVGATARLAPAPSEARSAREAAAPEAEDGAMPVSRSASGRRRRRSRGGRRPAVESAERTEEPAAEAGAGTFEEVSLFDLDDDSRQGDEGGEETRVAGRRRRGRRRGRSGPRSGATRDGSAGSAGPPADDDEPRPRRGAPPAAAVADDDDDGDDEVVPLAPDAPEPDEDVEASYDAADLQEEPLTEGERLRLERERRRLARVAKTGPPILEPVELAAEASAEAAPQLPRGRAAILAHADRNSVAAAIVLARDVRQVEGLWIYPQSELMTFFRSVCTDLRDNTPIYVIGFAPTPAREVIQAASLYRGRLVWFDHHVWPPEDLGEMSQAIGAPMLEVVPGCDSSLPLVLTRCTRRSRFTDKLVDLFTGRFSQHDFERWGRVWWARVGAMLERIGDRRADVELLLAGRPSDLSREAARVEAPPVPDEIDFVATRDFRLVHFGGLSMVLLEVPAEMSLHLAARVARERYAAPISMARGEGNEVFVLGADDPTGRRAIDVGGMVDHLAGKFGWVEALPDSDHVARFRLAELEGHPERLDEVISEIAMGRTILER